MQLHTLCKDSPEIVLIHPGPEATSMHMHMAKVRALFSDANAVPG